MSFLKKQQNMLLLNDTFNWGKNKCMTTDFSSFTYKKLKEKKPENTPNKPFKNILLE